MTFLSEIWEGYRPYLVRYTIDFLVSGTILLGLFLFRLLTSLLPMWDLAGKFIGALHSLGAIAAMAMFVWTSVNDTIQIHGKK
jgi:hypothetical protein